MATAVTGGSSLGTRASASAKLNAVGAGHKLEASGYLGLGAIGMCLGAFALIPVMGHVGWAIELEDGQFLAGETVPSRRHRFTAPNESALRAWFEGRHMFHCKVRNVAKPNPARARALAEAMGQQPYELFGANCLDETHDVLNAYGWSHLPKPALTLGATLWFLLAFGDRR